MSNARVAGERREAVRWSSDTRPKSDDDLMHFVCCDDNVSLCGLDVSGSDWLDEGDVCVVCDELDEFDCEVCGQ